MSLKSVSAKIFSKIVALRIQKWANNPVETQQKVFEKLISEAKNTAFGKDHDFKNISSFEDFAAKVPIRDYEALKPYVERVVSGEENVLWPG
ncbi:MAG TPA: hypothetical protein DDZ79_08750, partial [Aequorivita sp.]|nr:hypothetical protein [Aequorivita sp.]